jgi:uncharacterized membrane protein
MAQELARSHRDRAATGTVEPGGDVTNRDIRIASPGATGWWQNAWLLPVVAVLAAVMIISVPPWLAFDPAALPIPLDPNVPGLDYVLVLSHVLLATVALATLCLGIWPWLRVRHLAVHRWSGRIYVLSALSASLLTLPITYLNHPLQEGAGAYAVGVFWFTTTLIAYVAIRQGNEIRHRRWMLYSFAMATTIIWPILPIPFLANVLTLVGPLINLLVIKWWLVRTARRGASATT